MNEYPAEFSVYMVDYLSVVSHGGKRLQMRIAITPIIIILLWVLFNEDIFYFNFR